MAHTRKCDHQVKLAEIGEALLVTGNGSQIGERLGKNLGAFQEIRWKQTASRRAQHAHEVKGLARNRNNRQAEGLTGSHKMGGLTWNRAI